MGRTQRAQSRSHDNTTKRGELSLFNFLCFKRLICALLKTIQPKQENQTGARKTASTAI